MKYRAMVLILLLVLLATPLAGCGLMDRASEVVDEAQQSLDETPNAVPTPMPDEPSEDAEDITEPTATSEEVAEPSVEEEDIEVDSIDSLDSYRQQVIMRSTEDDVTEEWSMMVEFMRDPRAQRMVWSSLDEQEEGSSWEMIQIGTVSYMRVSEVGEPEEWMSMTSEDATMPDQDLNVGGWMSAEEYLDEESCLLEDANADVDGHAAVLYVCDETVFDDMLGIWMFGGRLISGSTQTWVSKEYDVPVRVVTEWEAEDEDGVRHSMYMDGTITAINQPITIEAPEGATGPGLPEDVPLYPDAVVTFSMSGMVTFDVDASLEDVTAFYQEEMDANGWDLTGETVGMMSFEKGARSATMMIEDKDGAVAVTIVVSE